MDYEFYDYYSPSLYSSGHGVERFFMNMFGGFLVAFLFFIAFYAVIVYIFQSVGLYHLSKERGIKHAWFSWIPIMNLYIIGRLINDKVVFGSDDSRLVLKYANILLPVITLVSAGFVSIPYIGWSIGIAVWIYQMAAIWRLFKMYRPASYVTFSVWSIFLSPGFFIFAIREDKPFDPLDPDKEYAHYYQHKKAVKTEAKQVKDELVAEEQKDEEALKKEYEEAISKEGMTEEQKLEAKKAYDKARHELRSGTVHVMEEEAEAEKQAIKEVEAEAQAEAEDGDVFEEEKPE